MNFTYWKIGILAFALSTAVACGKNKKDEGVPVSGERVVGPTNLPLGNGTLAGTQSARVVGTGMTQAQFDENVKILLSAPPGSKPEEVGSVDLQQGIQIAGKVGLNHSNGTAISTGSPALKLLIADSYTRSGQAEPFSITLSTVSGGASNGVVNLVFSDNYGTITINGTYDASNIRAKVTFANTQGSYLNRTSGTLGDFVIQTCAFFICQ